MRTQTCEINLYINGTYHPTNAIFSDKISVDSERDENEMFRRTKLNTPLTFVKEDFRAIYESPLDTLFEVRVIDSVTHITLAKGTFEKTDCKFNLDDESCEVKISSADDYDKIIKGKGNEYDIISLAPKRESVKLTKRGVLQIYFRGDNKITNVIGNMSYEIDTKSSVLIGNTEVQVESLTDTQLTNNLSFTKMNIDAFFLGLTGGTRNEFPNANGRYNFTGIITKQVGSQTITYYRYTNLNNLYHIDFSDFFEGRTGLLRDYSDNIVVESHGYYIYMTWLGGQTSSVLRQDVQLDNYSGGVHHLVGSCGSIVDFSKGVYVRVLLDNPSPTTPMGNIRKLTSENDLCSYNLNYRYTMPVSIYGLENNFLVSFEVQDEPTKWGVDGDGKYFVQPAPRSTGDNVIPVGWNTWNPASFWFNSSPLIADALDTFNAEWTLNDAYPLWSVIQVLLKEIDPDVTFEGTATYSQFLYGTISSSVILGWVRQLLYLSPITNVKKTYYNQAARKGKITLGDIFEMLRNTCQLYWFIDSQKRLRIEHITWFKNGGNYSQQNPLVDLTSITSPMSRKSWAFAQNTFDYDKGALIKRYEFGWSDQVSEVFDGYPIDIHNRFVKGGKTNKASVGKFVSDIDLIMSAPDALSDDTFALIGTNTSKNCPIAEIGNFGMDFVVPNFKMQNPYFSFYYLEMAYWGYDLGGDWASMGDFKTKAGQRGVFRVFDTKRAKKQTVRFPIEANKVGKEGLIATGIDNGEWTKAKYTPEDGMAEMELVMATRDDSLFSVGDFVGTGVTLERQANGFTLNGNNQDSGYGYVRVTANKDVEVTMKSYSELNYDLGWQHTSPLISKEDVNSYATHKISGQEATISFRMAAGTSAFFGYTKDVSYSVLGDAIIVTFVEE